MDRENDSQRVRFGVFELDVRTGDLRKSGVRLKLQDQPFQILHALLLASGDLVTREHLQQMLWPQETYVDFDRSLNAAVKKLRDVLGDDARNPRYIETLPKKGYRFIAPVELFEEEKPRPSRWLRVAALAGAAALATLAAFAVLPGPRRINPENLVETPVTLHQGIELDPSFSPDGSQVVYAAREGRRDVYNLYIEFLGSGQRRLLVESPHDDRAPTFSPDGRSIAFMRMGITTDFESGVDATVMTVPAGGGPPTEVAGFGMFEGGVAGVSWSPDGEWLAFGGQPARGKPMAIGLVPARGGDLEWLTAPDSDAIGHVTPAFSPDGSQLAFVRREGVSSGFNVFVLALKDYRPAGKPQRLTDFERAATSPAWTPDGNEILFLGEKGPGQEGIWSVHPAGLEEPSLFWRRTGLAIGSLGANPALAVTRNSAGGIQIGYSVREQDTDIHKVGLGGSGAGTMTPVIATSAREGGAEYSPDGTKVAYWQGDPVREVWLADEDGANARKLTSLGSRAMSSLSWSPDGKSIAFHAGPKGALDIFCVDADKGVVEQLTTHRADDVIPTFSRDGLWIYFASFRAGKWEIWKVPADGGDPELMIEKYYRTRQESWDGTKLYVNDWVTGDLLEFPLSQEDAQPLLVLPGLGTGFSAFEVAQSGIYFTRAGMLNRYSAETKQVEELFPLEGGLTSIHPSEAFGLVDVGRTEADLMMLEEVR